jgi:type 1 glutamine amidotransferase
LLEESGRFQVSVTNNPENINPAELNQYDVIVSNWCSWPDVSGQRWNPKIEKAFLEFIAGGKGFVAFHAASATHQDWPEYQQIVGGTWEKDVTGHGPINTFQVTIDNTNHPVTRGLKNFYITDELWHNVKFQTDINVLCTAYSSEDYEGSGKDEPVVIFTSYGKGRNFYNILGHNTATMQNKAWQTLMLRGIEWAATGEVTMPAIDPWPADSTIAKVQSVSK